MIVATQKSVDKKTALKKLYENYALIENHPFSDFNKNKIVPGVGNPDAPLLFLGEGPGADEDRVGEPFVGRAGQLLTKIIQAMGFERKDVFITNVVKCRLENNRAPLLEEIEYEKSAILMKELKILAPKIICCLGASAMTAMLGPDFKISQVRGQFIPHPTLNALIIPTYHPAYLLRNPKAKVFVWEDMQSILKKLNGDQK